MLICCQHFIYTTITNLKTSYLFLASQAYWKYVTLPTFLQNLRYLAEGIFHCTFLDDTSTRGAIRIFVGRVPYCFFSHILTINVNALLDCSGTRLLHSVLSLSQGVVGDA